VRNILLGELGPDAKGAVPRLIRLLDDETVASSALASLRSIGPAAKPAVPRVTALMNEPYPILTTLLKIGVEPAEIVPLAIRAKTNGPPWLRREAAMVLEEIAARKQATRVARLSAAQ
jgi:hypothetical protein